MVQNLINANGNPTLNQFVITVNNSRAVIFQSYRSTIAKWQNGKLHLSSRWDYSNTTSKHLYHFMRQYTPHYVTCKKDVLRLLKRGEIVEDLNYDELVV